MIGGKICHVAQKRQKKKNASEKLPSVILPVILHLFLGLMLNGLPVVYFSKLSQHSMHENMKLFGGFSRHFLESIQRLICHQKNG